MSRRFCNGAGAAAADGRAGLFAARTAPLALGLTNGRPCQKLAACSIFLWFMRLIYVETSIPSFYCETRPEPEHAARRQWTRDWWQMAQRRDTLLTSLAVIQELERAPEPKRSQGLALLESLPLLESPADVDEIISAYLAHRLMPRDAAGDARHVALATFHDCDILATWNCRHIANANKQAHIRRVNALLGYETPALVTPLELLETEP